MSLGRAANFPGPWLLHLLNGGLGVTVPQQVIPSLTLLICIISDYPKDPILSPVTHGTSGLIAKVLLAVLVGLCCNNQLSMVRRTGCWFFFHMLHSKVVPGQKGRGKAGGGGSAPWSHSRTQTSGHSAIFNTRLTPLLWLFPSQSTRCRKRSKRRTCGRVSQARTGSRDITSAPILAL